MLCVHVEMPNYWFNYSMAKATTSMPFFNKLLIWEFPIAHNFLLLLQVIFSDLICFVIP